MYDRRALARRHLAAWASIVMVVCLMPLTFGPRQSVSDSLDLTIPILGATDSPTLTFLLEPGFHDAASPFHTVV